MFGFGLPGMSSSFAPRNSAAHRCMNRRDGGATLPGNGLARRVDRRELAVEERLEEGGGGEGVELLFLPFAREPLAASLAGGELLLGVEAAEALVDEENGFARPGTQFVRPRDRRARLRPERAVHVQREPDDEPLYTFAFDDRDDWVQRVTGRRDGEYFVWRCQAPPLVAERESDAT